MTSADSPSFPLAGKPPDGKHHPDPFFSLILIRSENVALPSDRPDSLTIRFQFALSPPIPPSPHGPREVIAGLRTRARELWPSFSFVNSSSATTPQK